MEEYCQTMECRLSLRPLYQGGQTTGVRKPANTLRINHFKLADNKVFQSGQGAGELVVDLYLHDAFGDRIVEALKDVMEFTRNLIPPRPPPSVVNISSASAAAAGEEASIVSSSPRPKK